jgi:hypothetical protein
MGYIAVSGCVLYKDWAISDVCLLLITQEGLRGAPGIAAGLAVIAVGPVVVEGRDLGFVDLSSVDGRVCRRPEAVVELRLRPKVS